MRNLKNILLMALVTSLTIVSCTKEDEKKDTLIPPAVDETIMLTQEEYVELLSGDSNKYWTASSFTLAGIDQDCRMDDSFTFNADYTYIYDGGDNLCGDEDNVTFKNGTWTIDADNNILIFDQGTNNEFNANISAAANNELKLTGSYFTMPIAGIYVH